MIKDIIDSLIKQAILEKETIRIEVLRAIKNELLVYQTAKNAKLLDDAAEIAILNKMKKQRYDSFTQYGEAGRADLAKKESDEIDIINEFLPKKANSADIRAAISDIILENHWGSPVDGPCIPKKNMGDVIKQVKAKLVNVDGKELSDCVKTYLM